MTLPQPSRGIDDDCNRIQSSLSFIAASIDGKLAKGLNQEDTKDLLTTLVAFFTQIPTAQLFHPSMKNTIHYTVFVLLSKIHSSKSTPPSIQMLALDALYALVEQCYLASAVVGQALANSFLPGVCSQLLKAMDQKSLARHSERFVELCLLILQKLIVASSRSCDAQSASTNADFKDKKTEIQQEGKGLGEKTEQHLVSLVVHFGKMLINLDSSTFHCKKIGDAFSEFSLLLLEMGEFTNIRLIESLVHLLIETGFSSQPTALTATTNGQDHNMLLQTRLFRITERHANTLMSMSHHVMKWMENLCSHTGNKDYSDERIAWMIKLGSLLMQLVPEWWKRDHLRAFLSYSLVTNREKTSHDSNINLPMENRVTIDGDIVPLVDGHTCNIVTTELGLVKQAWELAINNACVHDISIVYEIFEAEIAKYFADSDDSNYENAADQMAQVRGQVEASEKLLVITNHNKTNPITKLDDLSVVLEMLTFMAKSFPKSTDPNTWAIIILDQALQIVQITSSNEAIVSLVPFYRCFIQCARHVVMFFQQQQRLQLKPLLYTDPDPLPIHDEFMQIVPMILGPLLGCAVDENTNIRMDAIELIKLLAQGCLSCSTDMDSMARLIRSNYDYLVDQLSIQLRLPSLFPKAPSILAGILAVCVKDGQSANHVDSCEDKQKAETHIVISLFHDVIEQVFINLEESSGSERYINGLLKVLQQVVRLIRMEQQGSTQSIALVPGVNKFEIEGDDDDGSVEEGIKLSEKIIRIVVHFIASENRANRLLSMEIIKEAIPIFCLFDLSNEELVRSIGNSEKRCSKVFLPLVHWVWDHIVARTEEADLEVAINAIRTLEQLVNGSGRFVQDRIFKQVWIKQIKPRLDSNRSNRFNCYTSNTLAMQLQLALLDLLATCGNNFGLSDEIKEYFSSQYFLSWLLCPSDPIEEPIFQAFTDKVIQAIGRRDSDWVWYLCFVSLAEDPIISFEERSNPTAALSKGAFPTYRLFDPQRGARHANGDRLNYLKQSATRWLV